jgi:hypothetical protein
MLHEIREVVRVGRTSAVDVHETLARNANAEQAIHAFLTVTAERSLAPSLFSNYRSAKTS